ncbi:MAG: hypothetical protein R6X02_18890 [Enhygromyxa sp.]
MLVGLGLAALQGCDPYEGPGIAGCDINCPKRGIGQGNAAISGIAEVDTFFGAVLDLSTAASNIAGSLRSELDAIALSVGLEPGASGADIRAAIEAKLGEALDPGGLSITHKPPRCAASASVAVAAAAECDASIEPGSASVKCLGACQVNGGVTASCPADAVLTCTGRAPELTCTGTCTGTCELELAAPCEGTCRGVCTGACSVRDAQDNCAGACEGDCQGSCELAAGGSCSGSCTGTCTYQPGEAGCQADASARCEAAADASVQCAGRCEGELEPPTVKPECEASVEAKANASLECAPPALELTWQWSDQAQVQTEIQVEFKAWVQALRGHLAVMLAARAKAEILLASLEKLGTAGREALEGATGIVAEGDVIGTFKLTSCAIPQLGDAATVVAEASEALVLEVDASLEILAALGI